MRFVLFLILLPVLTLAFIIAIPVSIAAAAVIFVLLLVGMVLAPLVLLPFPVAAAAVAAALLAGVLALIFGLSLWLIKVVGPLVLIIIGLILLDKYFRTRQVPKG